MCRLYRENDGLANEIPIHVIASTRAGDCDMTHSGHGSTCTGSIAHPLICRRHPVVAPSHLEPVSVDPSGFLAASTPDGGISTRAFARLLGRFRNGASSLGSRRLLPPPPRPSVLNGQKVWRLSPKPTESLATFVGGKRLFFSAHQTPSPGRDASNTAHAHGQPSARLGPRDEQAPKARSSPTSPTEASRQASEASGLASAKNAIPRLLHREH